MHMSAALCSNKYKLQTVKLNPVVCYQLSWTIWARDSKNLEILVGLSESCLFCEASWWCSKDPWKSDWRNFSSSGALDTALWSNGHDMEKNELDAFPTFLLTTFGWNIRTPSYKEHLCKICKFPSSIHPQGSKACCIAKVQKEMWHFRVQPLRGVFRCTRSTLAEQAPGAAVAPNTVWTCRAGLDFLAGAGFSGSFRCQLEQP